MTVIVTPTAKKSYDEIIEYLIDNWNNSVIDNFISATESTFEILETNPFCFSTCNIHKDYRKGHINSIISFYYKTFEDKVIIHLFWNNGKNPKLLKKLLRF